jgi:hypothetical protein
LTGFAGDYYGLSELEFYSFGFYLLDGDDLRTLDAFRFIGADENDGARWAAGDTIDLFVIDSMNELTKDNEGFELAGAVNLAAGGAVLLAAALM